ncbi:glycosyltransferase [Cohnella herbarum]|uniref:Glycosyltransferase n=1 Tax=Cohnella herbarum TaxID=2728023 RepID=A0A7Z2VKV9_9BACL|nr:glycosyltransferase [Cohnella herbarum]QJD85128.1 glycosyltransferase [Cohnella herbarum]
MNIAFDMFFAKTAAMKRGIGRYSQNLIESILKLDTQHSYFYFYPDVSNGVAYLKEQLQQFLARNRIDVYHMMSPFNLFHLPSDLFQAYSDVMLNKEWFGNTRVAATLYDVIPLVLEKQYLNHVVRPVYMGVIEMLRSCDIVYAISETTKQDAVRLAGMDPNKIFVIMGGVDARFKPIPNFDPHRVNAKYGIHKPYVLVTGGDDPRKNLSRLIECFIVANRGLQNQYQLVIVYNSNADEKRIMLQQAAVLGAAGFIIVTGYVPDKDLVELYNGATLFAFPSLYEGFGLPIVEAMACGVPVLTSHNSSLAEIGREAAYLVNPEDPDSITNGIYQMLSNPAKMKKLSKVGREEAKKYDWSLVAQKVLDGYTEICRQRIAVFASRHSLYPDKYGAIFDSLPYLTNRSEIDIYVEEVLVSETPDHPDSPIVIYPHTNFDKNKWKYDYVIYEIGNEDRFLFIVPYISNLATIPGVVVLNSVNLYDLTVKWTLQRNSIDSFYGVMQKVFGSRAEAVGDALLAGQIDSKDVPIHRYYLAEAKAVIVYSLQDKEQLINQGYRNIILAPVPAPLIDAPETLPERTRFIFTTIVTDKDRICNPIILRALKEMLNQGYWNWTYRIIGRCDPKKLSELKSQIAELGLVKHIKFTGEITAKQFKQQLKKTSVAIFLQDPAYLEAPFAPFATLAQGIPTVVFDGGAFRDLPNDAIIKIPEGPESEPAILRELILLYRSPNLRGLLKERASEHLEKNHSLPQFASVIQEAVESSQFTGERPTVEWTIRRTSDGVPQIQK